jgi:hypothetical protein
MSDSRIQKGGDGAAEDEYAMRTNLFTFHTVLTMMYSTQIYWIFGLFSSSGVSESRNTTFSETGSVFVLR